MTEKKQTGISIKTETKERIDEIKGGLTIKITYDDFLMRAMDALEHLARLDPTYIYTGEVDA